MSPYIDSLTDMEELRRLISEHQRQITQLYELYERAKTHNDTRSFVLHQSIEQLAAQLSTIAKDSRACAKQFDHLHSALKHFSMSELHGQVKKLQQSMLTLMQNQEVTNQQMERQTKYIHELENVLRRTYILADNQTALVNTVSESSEQLQDILAQYTNQVFPLSTPDFRPDRDVENSMAMSPLSLAENQV